MVAQQGLELGSADQPRAGIRVLDENAREGRVALYLRHERDLVMQRGRQTALLNGCHCRADVAAATAAKVLRVLQRRHHRLLLLLLLLLLQLMPLLHRGAVVPLPLNASLLLLTMLLLLSLEHQLQLLLQLLWHLLLLLLLLLLLPLLRLYHLPCLLLHELHLLHLQQLRLNSVHVRLDNAMLLHRCRRGTLVVPPLVLQLLLKQQLLC